jgi:predicted Zn finger-like uncharacterized protein
VLYLRQAPAPARERRLTLYTQCAKCETVFRLSAEVLRAAGGQVRCGRCGEVFNALARLAEDSSGFVSGESPLDMEARADSILESVGVPQVAQHVAKEQEEVGPPHVEIARLEVQNGGDEDQGEDEGESADDPDFERSLEFTLPPGELDRIFVESKQRGPLPMSRRSNSPLRPESSPPAGPQARPESPPPAEPEPHPESPPLAESQPHAELHAPEPPRAPAPASPRAAQPTVLFDAPSSGSRVSGLEVSEEVRRDVLEGFEEAIETLSVVADTSYGPAQRPRLFVWLVAAILAALLLAAQIVHQNRDWFVAHGGEPFGALVRSLYGAMGTPLPAPANLFAYQLRQWGVTGAPDANGILRVRASIMNTAAQLQPYPLLRVTLADRFGKTIGTRDFEPSEYMGKPVARLLAPGERADAIMQIVDPGKNAEGFEIDVCLRNVDQKISCANDVAAQGKR